MLQEEQQEEGAGNAQDSASAALQRRVEELALLVQQQAQQAEEQRKAKAEQDELIAQLQSRASPVPSPQHSAPASPRNERASLKRGLALHESARTAAAAAQEQAASQSRFARKEPRAQDLQEYDGASGAKLDDWLKQLAMARTAREQLDKLQQGSRGINCPPRHHPVSGVR